MPRIGTAYIDFQGRDANLVSATRRANQGLKRTRRQANLTRGSFARLTSAANAAGLSFRRLGFAALGAVAGFTAVARVQAKSGARIVETSRLLGLQQEQLVGLQRTFEDEGVALQTVNTALQRLVRRAGDAVSGNVLLQKSFQDLDVELVDNNGRLRSTYDLLLDIADGTAAAGSEQIAFARVQKILDTEGVRLAQVLAKGGEELRSLVEAHIAARAAIELQNESLKALDQSFTDVGRRISDEFARVIAGSSDDIRVIIEAVGDLSVILIGAIPNIASWGLAFIDTIQSIRNSVLDLTDDLTLFLAQFFLTPEALGALQTEAQRRRTVRETPRALLPPVVASPSPGAPVLASRAQTESRALQPIFSGLGGSAGVTTASVSAGFQLFNRLSGQFTRLGEQQASLIKEYQAFFIQGQTQFGELTDLQGNLLAETQDALLSPLGEDGLRELNVLRSRLIAVNVALEKLGPTVDTLGVSLVRANQPSFANRISAQAFQDRGTLESRTQIAGQITRENVVAESARQNILLQFHAQLGQLIEEESNARDVLRRVETSGNAAAITAAQQQALNARLAIQNLVSQKAAVEDVAASQADFARGQDLALQQLEVFGGAVRGIGNAFGQFFLNLTQGFTSLSDVLGKLEDLARNVIQAVIQGLIQIAIVQPLIRGITGAFGIPPGPAPAAAQHGGRQQGLTLVGEGGPELVDFRRPGQVYSTPRLREALRGPGNVNGGNSITFNIAINSTDGPGVRAAMTEFIPQIEQRTARAIALNQRASDERLNRPTQYRKSVRGF